MPRNILKGLSVVLGAMFLYGCAASKSIEVRRYVEVKDRTDQVMDTGNAGFLAGTPQPEDRSDIKKTRKVYVVEVSTGTVESKEEAVSGEEGLNRVSEQPRVQQGMFMIPSERRDVEGAVEPSPSFVEYTVQKDDTMQKISKKFYDSYSKWPRIYDANKGVIDNPDRIKPGIVIQVPVE